ncbi:hypothetical protein J6O48_10610 [bacterium]|nr:hypothetical protein [bacterium]
MIEDFISELEKPCRAIELLLIFLHDYINDDIVSYIEETQKTDKLENTLAIVYALHLVNTDIERLKKEYYNKMVLEKYS